MVQTGSTFIDLTTSEMQFGWSNTDSRTVAIPVAFARAFPKPPVVMAALAGIDADMNSTKRFQVEATSATATGFNITLHLAYLGHVNSITVSWLAVESES